MAKKQFGDITVNIETQEDEVVAPVIIAEPARRILSFEQWWATQQFPAHLFGPLQTHMEKKGYVTSQDFEAGVKNFGL
jgi:hypothetical protein